MKKYLQYCNISHIPFQHCFENVRKLFNCKICSCKILYKYFSNISYIIIIIICIILYLSYAIILSKYFIKKCTDSKENIFVRHSNMYENSHKVNIAVVLGAIRNTKNMVFTLGLNQYIMDQFR